VINLPIEPTHPYEWIASVAHLDPTRRCLEDERGLQLTYAQAHAAAGRHAAALASFGVGVGDRVAIQVEKSIDAVLVYLACLRIGAAIVPLNTAYTANELDHFLSDSRPTLFLVAPDHDEQVDQVAIRAGCSSIATLGVTGDGTYGERVAANLTAVEPTTSGPDGLAALLYTSGTTGRSKGAMITRGNLLANARALAEAWQISAGDTLVHVLPLFHVHGLFLSLNALFAAGGSVRLHRRFDPVETITSLSKASVFMGVPTHYTRLLDCDALSPETVRNVRLFVSGSAPLLAETHRAFEMRTGKVILERYGMTETLVNTSNPYHGPRKPGSVGLPLPGVELRITESIAAEDGQSIGMIEVRGPNVCAGYWRDPEKTAADRTDDGFFRTGDLGHLDCDGYLHISGRAKDLVITGGYNVYPKEIEMELDSLPGIVESAVFGIKHPDFGEGVTAAVTVKAGTSLDESEMISTLRERLAAFKVPKRILVVDELPRNTMGKVQKNRLREQYSGLYLP
jgi:malonyl-CoA/methylmalonyl-CoA synthetase